MNIKKTINDEFPYLVHQTTQLVGESAMPLKAKSVEETLKHLEELNLPDQFYLVMDYKKGKITWSHGFNSCLGYAEKFTSEAFFPNKVHPFIQDWFSMYGYVFYKHFKDLLEEHFFINFRYVIDLPVRKADGTYVCVRKTNMTLEIDEKGFIRSSISHFIIIGDYKGQSLHTRVFKGNERWYSLEAAIQSFAADYADIKPEHEFTEDEFSVLKKCYEICQEQSRGSIIKDEFNLSPQTRDRMLLIIKNKIIGILNLDMKLYVNASSHETACLPIFKDTYDAAKFFKESWILDILDYRYQKNPSFFAKKRTKL